MYRRKAWNNFWILLFVENKSISILDITSFRKINQRWKKISLVNSCFFTKFFLLNTSLHSKRQYLCSPLQGPTARCGCSVSHAQGLFSVSFTHSFRFILCDFHISFHSNKTLWTPFTPVINISRWPYMNLCCGQLHAHVLARETSLFHKDAYLFLNACGKGTHLFPLWFHYTSSQSFMKYI